MDRDQNGALEGKIQNRVAFQNQLTPGVGPAVHLCALTPLEFAYTDKHLIKKGIFSNHPRVRK